MYFFVPQFIFFFAQHLDFVLGLRCVRSLLCAELAMGDLQPTQEGSAKIKRKRTHEDDGPAQNKTDEEEAPTLLHGGVCLFLAKKLPAFVQAQLTSSLAHGLTLNNKKIQK